MKKVLLILVLFFACKNTTAIAHGVPDTLQYLKTIVQNKSQYIGQPFSKLLKDLEINIQYFSPDGGIWHDRSKETSTSFSFYFPTRAEDINLAYPFLKIIWKDPLNALQSGSIYDQSDRGRFSSEARLFYLSGIIEDIKILE